VSRPPAPGRDAFLWFRDLPTRWMDNDMYGHVNNVVYYSYFDTLIAHFLIEEGGFDPYGGSALDLAVETGCRFHRPLAFPDVITGGLAVAHLGTTSVRWRIGLFRGEEIAADGFFVHVFVDRQSQRPAPIPEGVRRAALRIRST
jgi:acyl-CoA thioester hydrolase